MDKVERPKSVDELRDRVQGLIDGVMNMTPSDVNDDDGLGKAYAACVEAMRDASIMAFDLVAAELGVTGFQASVAAISAYGIEMGIDGPFMVVKMQDVLFPQSLPVPRVVEWIQKPESREWIIEQAKEKIAAHQDSSSVSPRVWKHWQELADGDF